jgi:eukaryotic-like serine/threonine-protein kinase
LASRIARGVLAPAEALGVCSKIADALEAMHDRGLVHRDVKPSNVGFSAENMPKLLDFGLAYLLDEGLPRSPRPLAEALQGRDTSLGRVAGTAIYLSPEALAGRPSAPSQDLWSLALVLYECLIGPDELRSAVQRSRESAASEPFPGLEQLSAEHPSIAPVVAFLTEALSHDMRRRPPTAAAFRDALHRLPYVNDTCVRNQPSRR